MAITTGPNLGLPINGITGDVWDTALRQLLRALDQLPFIKVLSRILTSPPASPANGDAYIVADGATDDWAGSDRTLAVWTTDNPASPAGVWEFYQPKPGWLAWSIPDSGYYVFATAAWVPFAASGFSSVVIPIPIPHPADPNFALPHGLSGTPRIVIPVSKGGLVYLQDPIADDTNVNVTTSDPTVDGFIFVIL